MLLAVTLLHWAEFETTLSTTLVMWVGLYVFDPMAITLLLVTHRMLRPRSPAGTG